MAAKLCRDWKLRKREPLAAEKQIWTGQEWLVMGKENVGVGKKAERGIWAQPIAGIWILTVCTKIVKAS